MNLLSSNEKLIPIHIGLLGHIDAGKTAIARCLTELVSTAGLDKHPQAQERGITIDLGFTFFALEKYMITLVDAPGHADLIRSVVSCANIIDIGFLVIDATQGPQVQTGEHFLILTILNIQSIIFLINKIDLVSKDRIAKVRKEIKAIIKGTRYEKKSTILEISAKKYIGFEELKISLLNNIAQLSFKRQIKGTFKFLIDHHFNKKGQGTILTGTVISGNAKIGDQIIILPQKLNGKVRSVQKWKKSDNYIEAGDRCGISISDIDPRQLSRGSFATFNQNDFIHGKIFEVNVKLIPLYDHSIKFGQFVNIHHGMMALNGRIFPYIEKKLEKSDIKIKFSPDIKEKSFNALIWIDQTEYVNNGDKLLLSRLDLSPKSLRIMGSAEIIQVLEEPILFFKEKVKKGRVKNAKYRPSSVIVENLSFSLEGAHTILNLKAEKPFGKIISTFGQKGNVEVQIDNNFEGKSQISEETDVFLKIYKKFKLDYSRSYR